MSRQRKRTAYDMAHVKSVSAWALHLEGKPAGKIVANWSDNPAGSVCTATVSIWIGPLAELPKSTESAGGYGYHKLSACLASIFHPFTEGKRIDGGTGAIRAFLESKGYSVMEVL